MRLIKRHNSLYGCMALMLLFISNVAVAQSDQALFDAINAANHEKVTQILDANSVDAYAAHPETGEPAMIMAARLMVELYNMDSNEVRTNRLKTLGSMVNHPNFRVENASHPETGDAMLHYMLRYDDYSSAIKILGKGFDTNVKNKLGETPLHAWAKARKYPGLLPHFLFAGAKLNAKDNIGIIIKNYASLTFWKEAMTRLMIQLTGAKVNKHLTESKKVKLMAFALENGADVHERSRDGKQALMYAAQSGELKMVKLLLKHGADVNAQTNPATFAVRERQEIPHNAQSPLHYALYGEVEKGFSSDSRLIDVALHVQQENTLKIAVSLLKAGANPNAQNIFGITPYQMLFDHYVKYVNQSLVSLFVQHGAKLDIRERGTNKTVYNYIEKSQNAEEFMTWIDEAESLVSAEEVIYASDYYTGEAKERADMESALKQLVVYYDKSAGLGRVLRVELKKYRKVNNHPDATIHDLFISKISSDPSIATRALGEASLIKLFGSEKNNIESAGLMNFNKLKKAKRTEFLKLRLTGYSAKKAYKVLKK